MGTGVGRTRLSAFDAALRGAGTADFNLVRLSSVIPPGSDVRSVARTEQVTGGIGDVLYCVYAEAYASIPLEQAWAGVSWSMQEKAPYSGLFVEHHASSRQDLEFELAASLEDLGNSRGGGFRSAGTTISSIECVDHPVCAVAIATYRNQPWT